MGDRHFASQGPEETRGLGQRLGKCLKGGETIGLIGELGSGKTTFVQGLAVGMGVQASPPVTSPSFIIIRGHRGPVPLYHLDLFRLSLAEQMEFLGIEEFFSGPGVSVVEWADRFPEVLPQEFLEVRFHTSGEKEREIVLIPHGSRYRDLIESIPFRVNPSG